MRNNLTRYANPCNSSPAAFGGLIGLAIDAISGGMYKLTPDQIVGELKKTDQAFLLRRDTLYMAVVLHPDPQWEKVGQLKKVAAKANPS